MSSPYPKPPFPDNPPPKSSSSSTTTIVVVVVAVAMAMGCLCGVPVLIALLLPAVQMAREAARQQVSMNNLRQIGVALHEYHDTHKTFPPAFIPDEKGQPRTSWRTLILPFMEQEALYDRYDFNVAWDDPKNEAVRQTQLQFYRSPRSETKPNGTNYVVVTRSDLAAIAGGQGATAFPGAHGRKLADLRDGTANTILVIEIRNSDIEWSEPRDIDFSQLSTDPSAPNSINQVGSILVLMGDGSARRLDSQTPLETIQAMLTADGSERVAPPVHP